MAFCDSRGWTIDFFKDPTTIGLPSTSVGRLFFDLTITSGAITGYVYLLGVKLSPVTGTCREVTSRGIAFMDLMFTWGADVVLIGIVRQEDSFVRFKGRYCGFPSATVATPEVKRLALLAVDPGETGTGNGTQT